MRINITRRRFSLALLFLFAAMPVSAASIEPHQPTKIEADMLDGTKYSLADSSGQITVLSIWSPESLAARKCIWELQRFALAYQSRGVRTVAISADPNQDKLRLFMAKRKLSLPVGILGNHDLGQIDELHMPYIYIFDRDGQLKASYSGLFSYRKLEQLVAPQMRD